MKWHSFIRVSELLAITVRRREARCSSPEEEKTDWHTVSQRHAFDGLGSFAIYSGREVNSHMFFLTESRRAGQRVGGSLIERPCDRGPRYRILFAKQREGIIFTLRRQIAMETIGEGAESRDGSWKEIFPSKAGYNWEKRKRQTDERIY